MGTFTHNTGKIPKNTQHTQYIGIRIMDILVHMNSIRVNTSKIRNILSIWVSL